MSSLDLVPTVVTQFLWIMAHVQVVQLVLVQLVLMVLASQLDGPLANGHPRDGFQTRHGEDA